MHAWIMNCWHDCVSCPFFVSPWLFEGWDRFLVLWSGLLLIKERHVGYFQGAGTQLSGTAESLALAISWLRSEVLQHHLSRNSCCS